MSKLDIQKLDQNIRDGIQLLRTVSTSKAFTPQEKRDIDKLVNDFLDRINNTKLKLGIIGEFNAGKSTLLNAIIGKKVVATSDKPCTPVPIYINGGVPERLEINMADGQPVRVSLEEYSKYTTDGEAPDNVISIGMTVESRLLLENKITLVDTPGINAINPLHTQITESVLPELNAAILLMYSKQPGSKSTIEFLKNASNFMDKIFVCISKSDFLSSDQIDRVVDALPERLSKHSGVNIDKVYPIHFDDNGGGDDFNQFFKELNDFMLNEWYQTISRDLSTVLADYATRVSSLVQNKLELEERLFFAFMQETPIDFSPVSNQIMAKVDLAIDEVFDIKNFTAHVARISKFCLNGINNQLITDLEPNKTVLLFFDKRADQKLIDKSVRNSGKYFEELKGIAKDVDNRVKQFTEAVQNISVEYLKNINNMLADFRNRVKEEITTREEIINAAKKRRLIRWVMSSILTIAILGGSLFLPHIHFQKQYIITISIISTLLLVFSFIISRKPTQKDLNFLAEKEIAALQCFSVPEFLQAQFGAASIRGVSAANAFDLNNNQQFQQTGKALVNATRMGLGNAAGLEVAVVLTAISSAISFLNRPKAKDVYQEIYKQANSIIENNKQEALISFSKMRIEIRKSVEEYVNSLPSRYSAVLNEAFENNSQLLGNRKKTLSELEFFITRLKKLNADAPIAKSQRNESPVESQPSASLA